MREKGLAGAELAEGLGRLNHESAAPASRALEAHGLDCETAGAVVDLAMALLASQLTPEKAFRLGSSRKALAHFENCSREWQKVLRRRAEDASENVVRFRPPTV